jgi:mono/diheme cytochrome c family protein
MNQTWAAPREFTGIFDGFLQRYACSHEAFPEREPDMVKRLALVLLLFGNSAAHAQERARSVDVRGRELAADMCSQCHAVGSTDVSQHLAAPPFRNLDRRVDLDTFVDRLRDGLIGGHPDMPAFRFTREDAQALVRYLKSIAAQ